MRYYSSNEVRIRCSSEIKEIKMRIFGEESYVMYGFRSDSIGLDFIVCNGTRYAVFCSPFECLFNMSGLQYVYIETFIICKSGSVLIHNGICCGLWQNEKAFEKCNSALWSKNEVNSALRAVCDDICDVKYDCLVFATTMIHNLVAKHVSFSYYAEELHEFGLYEHVSVLGNNIWQMAHQPLFSESVDRLTPERLIELIDCGYALLLSLEKGNILPRSNGELMELPCGHAVVLLRLDDGDACIVDNCGCVRCSDENIALLCKVSSNETKLSFGCIVFGVCKDGYMLSIDDVVDAIREFNDECFVSLVDEITLHRDAFFDISQISGVVPRKFSVLSPNFESEVLSFYHDAYSELLAKYVL